MPIRMLRDFTDSDRVDKLSAEAERLYVRLFMKADDFGRYFADPKRLKAFLFPLKDALRETDISRWLAECEAAGLLRFYEVAGKRYMELWNFGQRLRSMRKIHPQPPQADDSPPVAASRGKSPPEWNTNGIETEEEHEGAGVLAALALRLNELYKRKPSDHWTYAEQSTLAEIARREGVMDELNHILAYRRSMPSGDRRRFFPQSIYSFLSKWTETLDKARVQCPVKDPPRAPAALPARPTQSSPASATMLRESIAFLEREHPKSPMLEAQRRQLREMESK